MQNRTCLLVALLAPPSLLACGEGWNIDEQAVELRSNCCGGDTWSARFHFPAMRVEIEDPDEEDKTPGELALRYPVAYDEETGEELGYDILGTKVGGDERGARLLMRVGRSSASTYYRPTFSRMTCERVSEPPYPVCWVLDPGERRDCTQSDSDGVGRETYGERCWAQLDVVDR